MATQVTAPVSLTLAEQLAAARGAIVGTTAAKPKAVATPKTKAVPQQDPYQRMVAWTHAAIVFYRNAEVDETGKPKYKGINTVYSGFYRSFAEEFGLAKEQVWQALDLMQAKGDIGKHGVRGKGGARGSSMIYLPSDMPERKPVDTTGDRNAIAALLSGK